MQRRMFSPQIIDTDAFMDMSQTAQLLYFHLAMRADDDGFVSNPKKIMRMVGSTDDDYKILLAKRFLIAFESGVCVIKHWRIHNLIRKDRYHKTTYTEEKSQLSIKSNGSYTLATKCQPNDNQRLTEVRLGKDRLGKVNTNLIENNKEKEVKDSDEKSSQALVVKEKKADDIAETIDLFKNLNPTHYKLFGNKTQRSAVERMLKHFGREKIERAIAFVETTVGMKFAPVITTPYQLETKWGELQTFYAKEKGQQISVNDLRVV